MLSHLARSARGYAGALQQIGHPGTRFAAEIGVLGAATRRFAAAAGDILSPYFGPERCILVYLSFVAFVMTYRFYFCLRRRIYQHSHV
jgi:uncharacterized protein involved in response to NO